MSEIFLSSNMEERPPVSVSLMVDSLVIWLLKEAGIDCLPEAILMFWRMFCNDVLSVFYYILSYLSVFAA